MDDIQEKLEEALHESKKAIKKSNTAIIMGWISIGLWVLFLLYSTFMRVERQPIEEIPSGGYENSK